MTKKLSIVIPVFNEIDVLASSHNNLVQVLSSLTYTIEIIYVDDGSRDGTGELIETIKGGDNRVKGVYLSRNFGHQAALTAGLDKASGDVIISMDCDGQHPPQMIPEMVGLVEQGYDIVQTQRAENQNLPALKKFTSNMFYSIINKISGTYINPGSADFRAMSRQALDALKAMPEYHRFLRGMIAWMGYRTIILPYNEAQRMSGVSKYSLGKMVRLASDAVFSFSLVPLYIGLSVGGAFILLALAQIAYVLFLWAAGMNEKIVPGWSSLMAVLLIASGIIMILLGFIGVYIGYIFQQVKGRPVYLVKNEPGNE
jgi:dolichol-phosphate mannosyltransferase